MPTVSMAPGACRVSPGFAKGAPGQHKDDSGAIAVSDAAAAGC